MTDEPADAAILNEARGAHETSRKILGLMLKPTDDPVAVIIATLRAILITQQTIQTRLDIIDRKLSSRG